MARRDSRSSGPPPTEDTVGVLYVDADVERASAVADSLEAAAPDTNTAAGTRPGEGRDLRFTVHVETDPDAALEVVADGQFDAVVAAYDLSTTTGVDLLRAVRRDRPALPFVLVARRLPDRAVREALAAGADDCLPVVDETTTGVLATRLQRAVSAYWTRQTFDALVDNPLVLGARVAPDGTVEGVNETAVETTGVPVARCVGTPFWSLPWWVDTADTADTADTGSADTADTAAPADVAALRRAVDDAAAGSPVQFRARYDAAGETRSALCLLLPVGRGETVRSIQFVGQDVTDWARHERRLERQNRRLGEFSSIVSHDLRSPLAVASGHLDLASRECDSDHLDHTRRALVRMDQLVTDLRTLARQGRDLGSISAVSLADVARRSWEIVDTDTARLVVTTDLTICGDETRLIQLFENLFRNSVEHGSTTHRSQARGDSVEHSSTGSRAASGDSDDDMDNDRLTVTVGSLPDAPGFYVEDTGPGIPPDEREVVFEAGHSTSPDGTGFGLKIVAEIVAAHGWEVSVTAGRSGGARFEVCGVDVADGADVDAE